MVGSEMLRMRFELNLCLGFRFINRAELKMTATPPPLPVSVGMCVNVTGRSEFIKTYIFILARPSFSKAE